MFRRWFSSLVLVFLLAALPLARAQDDTSELNLEQVASFDTTVLIHSVTNQPVVAWSPDGTRVALVTEAGDLELWDVASRQRLVSFVDIHATAVDFSADGTSLAVAGDVVLIVPVEAMIAYGDIDTSNSQAALEAGLFHMAMPNSQDYARLVYNAEAGLLLTFRRSQPSEVLIWDVREPLDPSTVAAGAFAPPRSVDVATAGGGILYEPGSFAASANGFYGLLFDGASGVTRVELMPDFESSVVTATSGGATLPLVVNDNAVADLSADGSTVIISDGTTATVYDVESGETLVSFDAPAQANTNVLLSQSGRYALRAIGGASLTLTLFDTATGASMEGYPSLSPRLALSPEGAHLFGSGMTMGDDGPVFVPGVWAMGGVEPDTASTVTPEFSDVDCTIDLSATMALLSDAQASVEAGDGAAALAQIAQARAKLEGIEALCGGVGGT